MYNRLSLGGAQVVSGACQGEEVSIDDEGEEMLPRRSFLASLGAGKYTNSIRMVTENSSSRVKASLLAAMFQELIRQDDVRSQWRKLECLECAEILCCMWRSTNTRLCVPLQADRIQSLMEHLVSCRTGPVPKAYREQASSQRPRMAGASRVATARPSSASSGRAVTAKGRQQQVFR